MYWYDLGRYDLLEILGLMHRGYIKNSELHAHPCWIEEPIQKGALSAVAGADEEDKSITTTL